MVRRRRLARRRDAVTYHIERADLCAERRHRRRALGCRPGTGSRVGLLNFLLNFVPLIGNIVGVVPPTLYAVVQFQNASMLALMWGLAGALLAYR